MEITYVPIVLLQLRRKIVTQSNRFFQAHGLYKFSECSKFSKLEKHAIASLVAPKKES